MSWYYRSFRIIRRCIEYTYSDLLPYSIGNTNNSWNSWEWRLTTHLLAGYCGMGLTKENFRILSQFLDSIIWRPCHFMNENTGVQSRTHSHRNQVKIWVSNQRLWAYMIKGIWKYLFFSISESDLQSCSNSVSTGVLLPHWAGLKLGSSWTFGRCTEELELSYGCRNCHGMGLCACSSRTEMELRERSEGRGQCLGCKILRRALSLLSIKLKYTLFLCIYYFWVGCFFKF